MTLNLISTRHRVSMLAVAVLLSLLLLYIDYNETTSFLPSAICIGNNPCQPQSFSSIDQFASDCELQHPTQIHDFSNPNDTQNHYLGLHQDALQLIENTTYPYTIVTAFSSNHFCSFEAFLYSLRNATSHLPPDLRPRIVVYSLGILPKLVPALVTLQKAGYFDFFVDFDWSLYPRFWHITGPVLGHYAWKLGVIDDVARRWGGIVFWLDSGDKVTPEIITRFPQLVDRGFWSPKSPGDAIKWTHPKMFEWFGERLGNYVGYPNCNGAAIGIDFRNPVIVKNFWKPLMQCAMDKECIGPTGSNRTNHRQDQAAITILARRNKFQCKKVPKVFRISMHNDRHCAKDLEELREKGLLLSPSILDLKFSPEEFVCRTD